MRRFDSDPCPNFRERLNPKNDCTGRAPISVASGFASNRVATEYCSVAKEYRRIVLMEADKNLILRPDLSAKALEINVR